MDILHIVWAMNYGGIEMLVCDLCRQQQLAGLQTAIVEIGPEQGRMVPEIRSGLCPVYRCELHPKLSFPLRLSRLLRNIKPGAVHYHAQDTAFLAAVAARLSSVPCVVETVHNIYTEAYLKGMLRRGILWALSALVTHRVAVSESVRQSTVRKPKVSVIYNGVDVSRFETGRSERAFAELGLRIPAKTCVVGHIGSFRAQKNHDAIIRVAAQVASSSRRPLVFVCAGLGPRFNEVTENIKALGLQDRVHLLGLCRKIPEFLSCTDIFFMPSKYEGLPIACIEAMAAGVVPVVSDVAGLNEVVCDDTVGRRFPLDKESVAVEAILELAENAALRRKLGQAARERAKNVFSLDACGRNYMQLYGVRQPG